VWNANTSSFPEVGKSVVTTLSFPVPLASAAAVQPIFLTETESNANCPGNFNEPKANPGFLCVFEGNQHTRVGVPHTVIENAKGETGKISANGAFVVFEFTEPEGRITSLGSWALTAP
jgi:hypothetical protein